MEGTYDVMFGSTKMGAVTVRRQGLYWQFSCRCRVSGEVMLELWISVNGERHNLGVLTPYEAVFGLEKKLAAKVLGQGRPAFSLRPRHARTEELFIPLRPEEPMQYLDRLECAYLAQREGRIGLVLPQEK